MVPNLVAFKKNFKTLHKKFRLIQEDSFTTSAYGVVWMKEEKNEAWISFNKVVVKILSDGKYVNYKQKVSTVKCWINAKKLLFFQING